MRVASSGYMTPMSSSRLVSHPDRQSSRRSMTQCPGIFSKQCPGITKQCPGITQLSSLVMRTRERLLKISRVPLGIIQTSLRNCTLALVTITQCPGLIVMMCVNKWLALLSPLKEKGIENIEERDEQERERKEVRHLIMMRAGPVSAQETHPVPAFQHK